MTGFSVHGACGVAQETGNFSGAEEDVGVVNWRDLGAWGTERHRLRFRHKQNRRPWYAKFSQWASGVDHRRWQWYWFSGCDGAGKGRRTRDYFWP